MSPPLPLPLPKQPKSPGAGDEFGEVGIPIPIVPLLVIIFVFFAQFFVILKIFNLTFLIYFQSQKIVYLYNH